MKWSEITVLVYDAVTGQVTDETYVAPIRCESFLYNTAPAPGGSRYYLLEESESGYDSIKAILKEVTDVLKFNPCESSGYLATSLMEEESIFTDVMTEFAGPDAWDSFDIDTQYVNQRNNPSVVAYNSLGSGKRATSGFFSPPIPFMGADSINIGSHVGPHGTADTFLYTFDIYPEGLIDGGSYNLDALYVSPGQSDTNLKVFGSVTIEIWFDEVLNKYNCQVYLTSYSRQTGWFKTWLEDTDPGKIYNTDDPTDNNQNDNNQGGNGDGIGNNDPIQVPELPDTDMTSSGSIAVYNPTNQEIKELFDYLHSANIGDAIVKLWQNPIQSIVSLHYLPYPMQIIGDAKVSVNMVGLATGVMAYRAKQFQTIYFGYAKVETSKQNAYTDRAPYTKCQIFLPGIGMRELNVDDVMGKYVHVKYNCDNVSGQCVAFIVVSPTSDINNSSASVRYSYSGSLAAPFPISQSNWGQTYVAAATLAAGALALGVSAAANFGTAAAGMAGTQGIAGATVAAAGGSGAVATSAVSMGSSAAQLMKPTVSRSGTVSGTTSLFSVRKPYLVIERPNVQDYADFNKIRGYACGKTYKLGNLKGYTEVESIHLNDIPATSDEIQEILNLLKSGVIL